jgi:exodeoxyribonuclease-3
MLRKKQKMRIISWNVNGIRAVSKKNIRGEPLADGELDCIMDLNSKYNPDVLVLQEIKTSSDTDVTLYSNIFPHITVSSAEKKGYSGVAILSKQAPIKVNTGFHHVQMSDANAASYAKEGRIITAEFTTHIVVGVYVPNSKSGLSRIGERGEWEKHIQMHLNYTKIKSKCKTIIYCGDLNVAHNEIDICNPKSNKNSSGFTPQERGWFGDLLASGFTDTFRHLHPIDIKYSWWSPITKARERNAGWRIDYILASDSSKLIAADILNDVYGSDHCPVLTDLV